MTAADGGAAALRVGIVGAGRMGRGIATAFALAGHGVELVDLRDRDAVAFSRLHNAALADCESDIALLAQAGLLDEARVRSTLSRISVVSAADAAAALAGCGLVFEAVPETMQAKASAFTMLGTALPADTIVASTTSTIDANALARLLPHPARFMNAHWLNPAHLAPLVEVSPADATDSDQVERLCAMLTAIGKVPIVCRSSPGYIVPRIQALAMNEAARLVEEGVASAADVDKAVRIGFGFRFAILGLLEFIDWGGGDILFHASRYLASTIDPVRFAAPEVIASNMAGQRNGLRDGRGFYDYADVDVGAYRAQRIGEFLALLRQRGMGPVIAGD